MPVSIKLSSSNLTKNLVKRTKLVQHLDRAFASFDGPLEFTYTDKESDDAWHPSGDCTPDVVELWNKAVAKLDGENHDPIGGPLRKTFLVGHFWHAVLQHLLVEELEFCGWDHIERQGTKCWGYDSNTLMHPSHPMYPRRTQAVSRPQLQPLPFHWARGMADVAPCSVPSYGDCLVDFKTMNGRSFQALADKNVYPSWIDKWECQFNIYMDWFDLEKSLMVGINKDSPHGFTELEFIRNQPLIDAIYEKWEFVSQCLDDNDPPHIDEDIPLPLQGPVVT